jgi:hypothetical protein
MANYKDSTKAQETTNKPIQQNSQTQAKTKGKHYNYVQFKIEVDDKLKIRY